MGKTFFLIILSFLWLSFLWSVSTGVMAAEKPAADPDAEDKKVIAVMEILELMEMLDDIDMFKDMDYLLEGDPNETHK